MTNEELAGLIKDGIEVSCNMTALYKQNKGLIACYARKYQGYAEMDDLMQEGYLGLYKAVYAYRPEDGAFSTCAVFWIKQVMQRYIENCGHIVRVPTHAREMTIKYNRIVSAFEKEYGYPPSKQQIKAFLGINEESFNTLMQAVRMSQIGSLSVPIGDTELTTEDTIKSNVNLEDSCVERVQQEQLKRELWQIVDELPEKQAKTIRYRYQEDKTMEQCGDLLHVSIEMIRQYQNKGLRELRKPSKSKRLRPYLTDKQTVTAFSGSVASFNRTWTSSTERAVLLEI